MNDQPFGPRTRVYSAPVLALVEHMKNVLEIDGIDATITNQYLVAAVGELPPIECWPQLWVRSEEAERALRIIGAAASEPAGARATWVCARCKEELEPQFDECWKCGCPRPEE